MEIIAFIFIVGFFIFLFSYKSKGKARYIRDTNKSNNQLNIKSFTGNEEYKIDVLEITCTCPDFSDRRSGFNRDDPRRLCKHLIRALLENGELPESMDKYCDKLQGIADEGRGFPLTKKLVNHLIDGYPFEIWLCDTQNISDPKYAWCDVYEKGKRYAYNIIEKRWSYKDAPKNSDDVVRLIHEELRLPPPEKRYTIKKNTRQQ